MRALRWLEKRALLHLHQASLAAHGGSAGIRDEGLLDSALARPVNLLLYEPTSDIAALAASYAFGISKNHPFVDGNKRAAFSAAGTFLLLNGLELIATETDAISVVLNLAAGEMSEEEFAGWIRTNSKVRS